jgi:hypothetical protein
MKAPQDSSPGALLLCIALSLGYTELNASPASFSSPSEAIGR